MVPGSPSMQQDRSTRFRFKRKYQDGKDNHTTAAEKRPYRRHRDYHRSKRSKTTQISDDADGCHDDSADLDPETAFRESLYDALGDDEGAQYWQNVYGQPVHKYPNSYENTETGELETMTDEEYASYVRRKMWEKSWEGVEAAKEERRKQQEREAQDNKRKSSQRSGNQRSKSPLPVHNEFDKEIEASLRRGAHRRERKRWKALWDAYLQAWASLRSREEKDRIINPGEQTYLKNHIAWPVESGKREDVSPENVKRFVNEVVESSSQGEEVDRLRNSVIKEERVKWHPDKIQQRYGSLGIDEDTIQGATAVFQILDQMWNDVRSRK